MNSAALRATGADTAFAEDAIAGLSATPKRLPAKYFYDAAGSALFEEITELPEYYLTRTELALLETRAPELAKALGPGRVVVEFGAGSGLKAALLLEAMERPAGYAAIEISAAALDATRARLAAAFPALPLRTLEADFLTLTALPAGLPKGAPVGFFPGSTIGNLTPAEAERFLARARRLLGQGSDFVLGTDLAKDPAVLIPAYDDAAGVTAAFNLNLIHRLNAELGAGLEPEAFRHEARWNDILSRIEMHLVATRDVRFTISGREFAFAKGSSIHTENSHKYGHRGARVLLLAGGWTPIAEWIDPAGDFAVILAEALPNRFAP